MGAVACNRETVGRTLHAPPTTPPPDDLLNFGAYRRMGPLRLHLCPGHSGGHSIWHGMYVPPPPPQSTRTRLNDPETGTRVHADKQGNALTPVRAAVPVNNPD